MKVNFSILDESLDMSIIHILVLEDIELFADIANQLVTTFDESTFIVFDDHYHKFTETNSIIISDLLSFNPNSSSVIKTIYSDLEIRFNQYPEVKTEIEQLTNKIVDKIAVELVEHDLNLEYDTITLQQIFKVLGIKIDIRQGTVLQKLYNILHLVKYLPKKELLILINCCCYFTQEELVEIMSFIELSHIKIIFIEPKKVVGVSQYIVDKDYVLFVDDVVE